MTELKFHDAARSLAAEAWKEDSCAQLVLKADRTILLANGRAERLIDASPGLQILDARLHATHRGDDKALGIALRKRWRRPTLFAVRVENDALAAPIAIRLVSATGGESDQLLHARLWTASGFSPSRAHYLSELYRLTRQERRIFGRILEGHDADWISAKEGISVLTYRTHVRNIYRKFSARSRGDLLRIILQFVE